MSNGNVMVIRLIAGLKKKIQCDSIDYNSIVRVKNTACFATYKNESVFSKTL